VSPSVFHPTLASAAFIISIIIISLINQQKCKIPEKSELSQKERNGTVCAINAAI
jgi:hypothetical protein